MTTGGPKRLYRRRRLPGLVVYGGVLVLAVVAVTAVWLMFRSLGSGTEGAASPSPSASSSPRTGRPKITGVVVQVLNGTKKRNLAADATDELARAGYDVMDPANSKAPRTVTLIEYRPTFQADAAYIKREFYPRAVLRKVRTGIPRGVDIEVTLGNDATG